MLTTYIPPQSWKQVGPLDVVAEDGSVGWLDIRGLVGLTIRDGYYIVLGVSYADTGGDPYGANYSPPPISRPLRVFRHSPLVWSKGGYSTEVNVSQENHYLFCKSLIAVLETLGYSVVLEQAA